MKRTPRTYNRELLLSAPLQTKQTPRTYNRELLLSAPLRTTRTPRPYNRELLLSAPPTNETNAYERTPHLQNEHITTYTTNDLCFTIKNTTFADLIRSPPTTTFRRTFYVHSFFTF
ncbi:hypothetical protein K438DRAFT_29470 [Mycena galopus ATCC 62051]|nr:hypothetical protein K438DRAFT_29470 [Mycena galopus ATCC 62051]